MRGGPGGDSADRSAGGSGARRGDPVTDTVQIRRRGSPRALPHTIHLSPDASKTRRQAPRRRAVPPLAPDGESDGHRDSDRPGQHGAGELFPARLRGRHRALFEGNEGDNCRPPRRRRRGRPDLAMSDAGQSALGRRPRRQLLRSPTRTKNESAYPAGASRVQSTTCRSIPTRSPADKLMRGTRAVPILAAGGTSPPGSRARRCPHEHGRRRAAS